MRSRFSMRVGIALDREHRRAGHRRGERLRAAHAAEAGREDPRAAEVAAVMLPPHLGERLVRPLHDALASRCRSTTRPSSGRTSSGPCRSSSLKCSHVAQCGTRLEFAIRTRGASGMRAEHADRLARLDRERLVVAEPLELAHDRVEGRPSCAPPCRCRRTRRDRRAARRPRGRGCSSASAARLRFANSSPAAPCRAPP